MRVVHSWRLVVGDVRVMPRHVGPTVHVLLSKTHERDQPIVLQWLDLEEFCVWTSHSFSMDRVQIL